MLPRKLPRILRFWFHGSERQLPRKVGSSAASSKASTKAFYESFQISCHEKQEATSTGFYVLLQWKVPQLPRHLNGFHDSSHGCICIVRYRASSRAYHLFDNMVDAHLVRDEGGFTVQWLVVAFHWVRVRVRVRVYKTLKSMSTTCR